MVTVLLCEVKMSPELKAIRKTAGMFAIAFIVISIVVGVLTSISAEAVGWILISMIFGYCVWIVYKINLNQYKFEQQFDDERNTK